jgi:osmotically inducible lipoprotein OsmB
MKSFRVLALSLTVALSALAGCATTEGAIVGGAAGHAIGGDASSTVGGAVLGGMIGHHMAK